MLFSSPEQIEERLAYWQKVLRLQDWRVTVYIVRQKQMQCEDAGAEVQTALMNKRATIFIRDPIDYPEEEVGGRPQDHERCLVHELLHLHFDAMTTIVFNSDVKHETTVKDDMDNDFEIGIEMIAEALVTLHREKQ